MTKESDLTSKTDVDLNDLVRIVTEEGLSANCTVTELKSVIEEGTATPYIAVTTSGDDKGLIVTEQFSVGSPGDPKESVFGGGDSYGVGLEDTTPDGTPVAGSAWHCTVANTTGLTIVSATDKTTTFASDTGSAAGLFNGVAAGNYILVGSEYTFGGAKVKTTIVGDIEPANVVAEYLKDSTPTWVPAPFMATKSSFPYTQRGNLLASEVGSEQWRFGFDPTGTLPPAWDKVTLNINGTDYTKYWARFRITSDITTDPTIEQIKLHTSRYEINPDGNTEFFGLARQKRTLVAGVRNLVSNNVDSPANQDVTYESGECVAAYVDNRLNDGAVDTTLVIQNIETGLDTSIPLVLEISYFVLDTATGDIEWEADVYDIADGFVYDGTATSRSYAEIDTVSVASEKVRRTVQIKIPVDELTDNDAIVIKIKRDATAGNTDDTLTGDVVLTNIRLSGYFWRN